MPTPSGSYSVRYARQAVRANPRTATLTAKVTSHPVTNLQTEVSDTAIDNAVITVADPAPIQNNQSRDQSSSIHEFPATWQACLGPHPEMRPPDQHTQYWRPAVSIPFPARPPHMAR